MVWYNKLDKQQKAYFFLSQLRLSLRHNISINFVGILGAQNSRTMWDQWQSTSSIQKPRSRKDFHALLTCTITICITINLKKGNLGWQFFFQFSVGKSVYFKKLVFKTLREKKKLTKWNSDLVTQKKSSPVIDDLLQYNENNRHYFDYYKSFWKYKKVK